MNKSGNKFGALDVIVKFIQSNGSECYDRVCTIQSLAIQCCVLILGAFLCVRVWAPWRGCRRSQVRSVHLSTVIWSRSFAPVGRFFFDTGPSNCHFIIPWQRNWSLHSSQSMKLGIIRNYIIRLVNLSLQIASTTCLQLLRFNLPSELHEIAIYHEPVRQFLNVIFQLVTVDRIQTCSSHAASLFVRFKDSERTFSVKEGIVYGSGKQITSVEQLQLPVEYDFYRTKSIRILRSNLREISKRRRKKSKERKIWNM